MDIKEIGGKIFNRAISEVLSFPCPVCKVNITENGKNAFCGDCAPEFLEVLPPFCPGCGGELDGALEVCGKCLKEEKRPWKKAVSIFRMNGAVQELIHRFKYKNTPELARLFGTMSVRKLAQENIKTDIIVPAPLHWMRKFIRGFNQSELLAEVISEKTGIPVSNCLSRIKWTKQQARLNREERKKNLRGAFSIKKPLICKNSSILLIDDVITTGSTLTAATKELLKAGAREVIVLIIARR